MRRTLAQDLTSRLPPGFIFPDAPEPPDTRMLVVTVLDAETDASGTVTLQAAWTLQSGQPASAALTQQAALKATLENRGAEPHSRGRWPSGSPRRSSRADKLGMPIHPVIRRGAVSRTCDT